MSICGICCNMLNPVKGGLKDDVYVNETPVERSGIYAEALLIGLNYKNSYPGNKLESTYNDINLVNNHIRSLNYFDIITTVSDEEACLYKDDFITKTKQILDRMSSKSSQSTKRLQLLVHYAGHGSNLADTKGLEKDGTNETWVLSDKMIVDDELLDLFGCYKLDNRFEIYIVSDSCHSGSILDLDQKDNILRNKIVCISGCQDSQTSAEFSSISGKDGNGYLTMTYVNELKARPKQNINSMSENITSALKNLRVTQIPQKSSNCENVITEWII